MAPVFRSVLRTSLLGCLIPVACGLLVTPVVGAGGPSPACEAPSEFSRFERPLSRIAARLAAGQPITIVAIGSSSTAGAGASSSAASYPSRLEALLRERLPNALAKVLNRGVNGETAVDMIARFDSAVFSEQPDLVLWQVGTNSVLRDEKLEASLIDRGLARLKASGADVVLIDPQFAPKVIEKPEAEEIVGLIGTAAKAAKVEVFHRFAVMRGWRLGERIPFETFLSPDGLHLNDWSYACLAKLLSTAIVEASTRALSVARVPAGSNSAAATKP
jgi:lysophospholipase L1-like esterase